MIFVGIWWWISSTHFLTWIFEPRHDKTNKVCVRPVKTQISLGIRPVWSESSLSAWRNLGPLATYWVHSKDSDQTGRMPRLIWVFAGRTLTLLVLSCRGSFVKLKILQNAFIYFISQIIFSLLSNFLVTCVTSQDRILLFRCCFLGIFLKMRS